jgi:hypothetical protein
MSTTDTNRQQIEWLACAGCPAYFIHHHCKIYDPILRDWLPFHLWPAQLDALDLIHTSNLTCILKARQLGLTWLLLGYALWQMTFRPVATVLVFSKRENEAIYLLGHERLRGMWRRLPDWMRPRSTNYDAASAWMLANGSVARAFPSNAGDSYTATLAIVDEADLVPDLDTLLGRVKPTIDAGGKLVLLSRADKSRPESPFKKTYRAAESGSSPWRACFLPWHVHAGRDAEWYERQRADILARTGSLDDLHEQYPASVAEALSPRSLDKRIAPAWLQACFKPQQTLTDLPTAAPSIPGLAVYSPPHPTRTYVIGADPAEGNPTSDDSALCVLDAQSGEEVASLAGKFQPSTLAAHIDAVGRWYNNACVMVERNNHGHAVLLWLQTHSPLLLLFGHDGKVGWLSSGKGKALLYDACADAFRNGETVLHSFGAFTQLSSIEGSTLRAPDGEHDDLADAYAIAVVAAPAALTVNVEEPEDYTVYRA